MKKYLLVLVSVLVVSAGFTSLATAATLCIESEGYCTKFRLNIAGIIAANGVYPVTGFEYGCGNTSTLISGTMKAYQGTQYFNIHRVTYNATYSQTATADNVITYYPLGKYGSSTLLVQYSDSSWDDSYNVYKGVCPTTLSGQNEDGITKKSDSTKPEPANQ